jgi:hypothetical protein
MRRTIVTVVAALTGLAAAVVGVTVMALPADARPKCPSGACVPVTPKPTPPRCGGLGYQFCTPVTRPAPTPTTRPSIWY